MTQGILAIFNDCRAGREAEFEAWFQGEHLLERLAVPGFLFGRRHQAISGACRLFQFLSGREARRADLEALSRAARQSDADDQEGHVGDFHQHEPHASAIAPCGAARFAAPTPSRCASTTRRT